MHAGRMRNYVYAFINYFMPPFVSQSTILKGRRLTVCQDFIHFEQGQTVRWDINRRFQRKNRVPTAF